MFLHENLSEFAQLTSAAAEYFSRAEAYVKKDYYATMMLREAVSRNPRFVFKGGTCLSKCYRIINRFSEDVDLGLAEEHVTESMRKAMKRAVVGSAEALGLNIENIGDTRSRRDYNRYDIVLPSPSTNDLLIVETAIITPAYPVQSKSIQSFIGEYCDARGFPDATEEYGLKPFGVRASSVERTFCDKVFAVCDYYLNGNELRRNSRHIYDLRKMKDFVEFNDELANLFATVRKQRLGKSRCLSADYAIDLAATLQELRDKDVYKRDYRETTMDLLYDEMSYENAVEVLGDIAEFVNAINWNK